MRPNEHDTRQTKHEKRSYHAPKLRELGNVRTITQALPSGPNFDAEGRRS